MAITPKWLAVAVLSAVAQVSVAVAQPHAPVQAAQSSLDRAQALEKDKKVDEALDAGFQSIESDPDFLAAHDWLAGFPRRRIAAIFVQQATWEQGDAQYKKYRPHLKAMEKDIRAKYEDWLKRFPNSLGVLYGMGAYLYQQESPDALQYLQQFVKRDSTNAKVFRMLAGDALRGGDQAVAEGYLRKAMALDPKNADYAFAYAYNQDPAKRAGALQDVVNRFPNTDRAADALSTMSDDAGDDAHRIQYLEQLRKQSPPEQSEHSRYAMRTLFELYLRTKPQEAVKLAQEMQKTKDAKAWQGRVELAQAFVAVNERLAANKPGEALALLGKLKTDRDSENNAMIERVKAQVMAGAGQASAAYRMLLHLQAKRPEEETQIALEGIGKQLHKTATQVQADVKTMIYAGAKPAPAFDLQEYTSDETVSLASLRGKVVLLTFWFPGCAPCAEEFPHFEAVMQEVRQKSNDVAYIGINVVRDQDSYVVPRVQKKKYSFVPLKGTEAVKGAKKGYAVSGAPTNFVIDRSGRIVYRDFMIDDARGEAMLERMIESVL